MAKACPSEVAGADFATTWGAVGVRRRCVVPWRRKAGAGDRWAVPQPRSGEMLCFKMPSCRHLMHVFRRAVTFL